MHFINFLIFLIKIFIHVLFMIILNDLFIENYALIYLIVCYQMIYLLMLLGFKYKKIVNIYL